LNRFKTMSLKVLDGRGNILFINHCDLKRCSRVIASYIDRYMNSEGVALPGCRITGVVESLYESIPSLGRLNSPKLGHRKLVWLPCTYAAMAVSRTASRCTHGRCLQSSNDHTTFALFFPHAASVLPGVRPEPV